ncbi:MAG: hypothetical protein JSV09_05765 [Thermoplasmata archaeon]|nr:MAG: hypothetical protein JSV09_05765 [Thermoplasmata archaeon]
MRKFKTTGVILLLVVSMCAVTISSTSVAVPSGKGVLQRPIEDFVEAQGKYGWYLMWGTNLWDREAYVDYAGVDNEAIIAAGGDDLGTTFSGTITEKVLKDGNTLVHVTLFTKNALTYSYDAPIGDFVYGSTVGEVIGGAPASLGNSRFSLTYITDEAPGAPMPDLVDMVVFGIPGTYPIKVNFVANSRGELNSEYGVPQGTPGSLTVVMAANFNAPGLWSNGHFLPNFWPVSIVNVQQIGK